MTGQKSTRHSKDQLTARQIGGRMTGISYMSRTLTVLKNKGFVKKLDFDIVERRLTPMIKEDFLNIIDVIFLDPARGVVGIQVCGQDWASHIRKITDEMSVKTERWLSTPGTSLELWGWRQVLKKRGGKAKVWKCRIAEFRLVDGQIIYTEDRGL